MLRKILTVIGLLNILSPKALIDATEQLALENPEECHLKSWVVPVARLEGVFYLLLTWKSETSYTKFKKFLSVIGALALLYPRVFIDYAARIAYDDVQNCTWKSWVYPFTRLVGIIYLLIGLNELRKDWSSRIRQPFLQGLKAHWSSPLSQASGRTRPKTRGTNCREDRRRYSQQR